MPRPEREGRISNVTELNEPVPSLRFDDLAAGMRLRLGTITLTREEAIAFAARYDPQPFHLDDAAAAENPLFGRLSASGWHTVVTMQILLGRYTKQAGLLGLAGGGVEDMRWVRPVFPPETLTVLLEVVAVRPSRSRPERGVLTMRTDALDDAGALAATLTVTGIFLR
ncbi:MaoC/PaaZ C-terminal domain-containing protein [Sphingomonas profundi]|uniref:MaoC/PaaZ C-terminal domain-containing protein n=1 Tax=Alterirhizorhabdus profundi TaxID=2681549 RepID=UPI0012E86DFF|nr:MaoC/PaaZ C-terminal domain-containing protein [Sphingomonas profundi]